MREVDPPEGWRCEALVGWCTLTSCRERASTPDAALASARALLPDIGIASDSNAPLAQPHRHAAGPKHFGRFVAGDHGECRGGGCVGQRMGGGGGPTWGRC